MLCALGDLVDDVIVWLDGEIERGTDTVARIFRRRGGSAANVAAFAAEAGHPARFVGRIGDDSMGDRLVADLERVGVDVVVQRGGRTGAVVVLVEPGGERSMLADRGSATTLDHLPDGWLDGVHVLHLTAYALTAEPLASTAITAAQRARRAGAMVSFDASSAAVLVRLGPARLAVALAEIAPDVLFANGDEAAVLGLPGPRPTGVALAVVKQGAAPTLLVGPGDRRVEVDVAPLADVRDTTGAGDAFAAGFLTTWRGLPTDTAAVVDATEAGHALAAAVLSQPGASLAEPSHRC